MKSAATKSSGRHIIGTYYISIMRLLCVRRRVCLLQTHTRNHHHDILDDLWPRLNYASRSQAARFLSSSRSFLGSLSRDARNWWAKLVCVRACRTERAQHKTKAVFPLNDVLIISATWRSRGHPDKIFQPVVPEQEFTTAAFSFKTLYVQVDTMHKE
jgi:hypothetical protein